MLKEIKVEKLFGYLDYSIKNLDTKPVTFLIAKNGMGKTTLLNLLYGLSNDKYERFRQTEYKSLEFTFSNGNGTNALKFSKTNTGDVQWNSIVAGQESSSFDLPQGFSAQVTKKNKVIWLEQHHDKIVRRASCGRHWTVYGKGHYDADEVLNELKLYIENEVIKKEAEVVDKSMYENWNVSFITAERLKIFEDKELQSVVNIISKQLVDSMKEHVVKASEFSKTFEHEFLFKLLNSKDNEEPDFEALKSQLEDINRLEKKVQSFGLYPDTQPIELKNNNLNSTQLKTLKTFLTDKTKRLAPHINFLKRLELFEELVNISLAKKSIKADKNEGLIVLRDGQVRLKLDQLSSGEQHLIIIAHKLIFSIPDNHYVLIDEPELSMHLEWQNSFATMLERIGELRNLRFLCATHSPSIIDSRIDNIRSIKL